MFIMLNMSYCIWFASNAVNIYGHKTEFCESGDNHQTLTDEGKTEDVAEGALEVFNPWINIVVFTKLTDPNEIFCNSGNKQKITQNKGKLRVNGRGKGW